MLADGADRGCSLHNIAPLTLPVGLLYSCVKGDHEVGQMFITKDVLNCHYGFLYNENED